MSVRYYPFSVVLHLLAVIIYGYSLFWLFLHELPPKDADSIGGRLKFLTYWDLWFQLAAFATALVCDLMANPNQSKHKTRQPLVVSLRDTLFNSIAFPFGAFVSVSFWAIYAIDRELIFPVGIEKWYPIWLNHTSHTFILPIVLVDNYLVAHQRHDHKSGLSLTIGLSIAYGLWILYLGLFTDHWVYPVLRALNLPLRVAFMLCGLLAIVIFYFLGGILNDMSWKSSPKTRFESRKKAK